MRQIFKFNYCLSRVISESLVNIVEIKFDFQFEFLLLAK